MSDETTAKEPYRFSDHQLDTIEGLVIKNMTGEQLLQECDDAWENAVESWDLDETASKRLTDYHDKLIAEIDRRGLSSKRLQER